MNSTANSSAITSTQASNSAISNASGTTHAGSGAAPLPDLALCPGMPLGPATSADDRLPAEAPVFAEPWQAQAFAMTLQLHERGLFTWAEWAAALTAQIRLAQAAGDPDLGDTYWQHWLAALEGLIARQGAGSADELARAGQAWAQAAERTPHGQPLVLQPGDYRGEALSTGLADHAGATGCAG